MKHFSAMIGQPAERIYTEKFAWIPKRLRDGSFIWLNKYIKREDEWHGPWHHGQPIKRTSNLSIQDAIIEKLSQRNK